MEIDNLKMDLENKKYFYFIGIGGIGMSALARYFFAEGKEVCGYDKTPANVTQSLMQEGIHILFDEETESIPKEIIENKDTAIIVYTPAIPSNHPQLNYFFENNYTVIKRAYLLGEITQNKNCIAIAGTHGKTSITSMTAHLFNNSIQGTSAFIGGISKNYKSNLLLNKSTQNIIVEADEYDRSFLTLRPNTIIIGSVDADHLDIYGTKVNLEETFKDFVNLLPKNGKLIVNENACKIFENNPKLITYGFNKNADYRATNITIKNACFSFDIESKNIANIFRVSLNIPGRLNALNFLAAIAGAIETGCAKNELIPAVSSYQGIVRRMDLRVNTDNFIYIDDYAHHPKEISETIKSVKEMFPDKTIKVIFQPHLFSRTRDFVSGFAQSLSLSDEVYLIDIYPAREEPIPGVTSKIIFDKITANKKTLCKMIEIPEIVEKDNQPAIWLTMGAGDIDQLVNPIEEIIKQKIRE